MVIGAADSRAATALRWRDRRPRRQNSSSRVSAMTPAGVQQQQPHHDRHARAACCSVIRSAAVQDRDRAAGRLPRHPAPVPSLRCLHRWRLSGRAGGRARPAATGRSRSSRRSDAAKGSRTCARSVVERTSMAQAMPQAGKEFGAMRWKAETAWTLISSVRLVTASRGLRLPADELRSGLALERLSPPDLARRNLRLLRRDQKTAQANGQCLGATVARPNSSLTGTPHGDDVDLLIPKSLAFDLAPPSARDVARSPPEQPTSGEVQNFVTTSRLSALERSGQSHR